MINWASPKNRQNGQTVNNKTKRTKLTVEVDIQLKEGTKVLQQKGKTIPIHMQPAVEKEIEKLKSHRHIEKAKNIDENCFVSPAVLTIKKDESVSIALDSRKFNKITRKASMPNMKELTSRISKKIAVGSTDKI